MTAVTLPHPLRHGEFYEVTTFGVALADAQPVEGMPYPQFNLPVSVGRLAVIRYLSETGRGNKFMGRVDQPIDGQNFSPLDATLHYGVKELLIGFGVGNADLKHVVFPDLFGGQDWGVQGELTITNPGRNPVLARIGHTDVPLVLPNVLAWTSQQQRLKITHQKIGGIDTDTWQIHKGAQLRISPLYN